MPILPQPLAGFALRTALMIASGSAGGFVASRIGLPMPWMLGSLLAAAAVVLLWAPPYLEDYSFPDELRAGFVALIGVMIGAQVTPDVLRQMADLPWTMAGLLLFIAMAHGGNYLIFHRLGGYSRPTAFYAGTPGGLMESIMMGEKAGADIRILMAQQFLRIILVISLLPLGLSLWAGFPVGSGGGFAPGAEAGPVGPRALLLIAVAAALGLALGRLIRLPAAQLTGPLLLSAAATLTGALDLHLPFWLIAVAQLVIGVTLGLRFKGADAALLRRCGWLSIVSVGYMLAIGAGFAVALHEVTGIDILALFISFAPGGVAEMSVVALSLAISPALVSVHHIVRIMLTVIVLGIAARAFGLR